jgi:hypothetical protein
LRDRRRQRSCGFRQRVGGSRWRSRKPNGSASLGRKLVAILGADFASYSRLLKADEEGTLAALSAFRFEDFKLSTRGCLPESHESVAAACCALRAATLSAAGQVATLAVMVFFVGRGRWFLAEFVRRRGNPRTASPLLTAFGLRRLRNCGSRRRFCRPAVGGADFGKSECRDAPGGEREGR